MSEDNPYDFLSGEKYEKLMNYATRLNFGKSRAKFQKEFESAIHNRVVALKLDSKITPGLHYALGLIKKVVFKKTIAKNYQTEEVIKIKADRKLLALIFQCDSPNGELPCIGIMDLYHQLGESQHSNAYKSLAANCLKIIELCCQVIDDLK